MMGLESAINQIQATVGALSGIKAAPTRISESTQPFPFAVTYPRRGTWEREFDTKKGLHTVWLEIHVSRQLLGAAIESALDYAESVPNALWNDPTLGGTVDTLVEEFGYEFGWMEWGGTRTMGWRFEVTFKQRSGFS